MAEISEWEQYGTVLTYENYDICCMKVITHLDKYINSLAYKLNNAVGTQDDYKQELILKALQCFRYYEYEMTVLSTNFKLKDLIVRGVTIIHNRFADLCSEFSKKKDTSLFTRSVDDTTENNPDKHFFNFINGSSTNEIQVINETDYTEHTETNNLIESLIKQLQYSELPRETIGFLKESINPSDSTEARYQRWLETTNSKNPHKNKGIPAKVICEELGIEYSKMGKIKEIIAMNLIKLGMEASAIKKFFIINDDVWKQYGLKKEKRYR